MRMRSLIPSESGSQILLKYANHPENVMIDLTRVCNQDCCFCYQQSQISSHGDPEILISLLQALAIWGVQEVLYLGGEPTLHPDLGKILETGCALGLKQRLISNGQNMCSQLANLFSRHNVEIGISLHGGRADLHDAVTNRAGSYHIALAAIKALQQNGVKTWVQYTPLGSSPLSLFEVHNTLERNGIYMDKYDINRLIKYQHREECWDFPDTDTWWNFLKGLPQLVRIGIEIHVEAVPHCWLRRRSEAERMSKEDLVALKACIRPCWMGFGQWAFSESGNPKLCPTLSSRDHEKQIKWNPQKLNSVWHNSPELTERRRLDFLDSPCISAQKKLCPDFYSCLGGCRHAAGTQFATHDPLRI